MEETTALYEQIKTGALAGPPTTQAGSHHGNGQLPHVKASPVPSPLVPFSLPPAVIPSQPGAGAHGRPRVDWTQFPKRPICSGRHTEFTQLYQWLVADTACLVSLFGLGGQGKTTLAAHLAWSLADGGPFERIIWRSLVNAPPFSTMLQGWLAFLGDEPVAPLPRHVDEQLALLLGHLRQQRCLLILDNVECVLQNSFPAGAFRAGYEAYGQLMHQIVQNVHQGCLVLISRIRPRGFDTLEMAAAGVQSLHVQGLTTGTGAELLYRWGLTGSDEAIAALMARYSGHPLCLKLAAMTVQEFFAGNLEAFLNHTLPIFDDLRIVLDQQFVRLSAPEKEVLLCLASAHQPMPYQALCDTLRLPPSQPTLLEAVRALQRRSLLTTGAEGLYLPNVVTEYIARYVSETVH
jgi:NACHT domain